MIAAVGTGIAALRRYPGAAFGVVVLSVFTATALFADRFFPWNPMIHPDRTLQGPSWEHILGTDYAGRDIFHSLVHGTRSVMEIGALTAVVSTVIAICVGMISGFARGKVDIVLMRITDIFLTIPSLPLIIVLTAYVQSSGVFAAVAILSVTFWAGLARAIRAQMLTLTERDFVEAARVLGLSRRHIIFREMLPNLVPFIAIGFIGFFTNAIFAAVGLSLLGLLPLDSSNWGQMLNIAINGVGALYSTDTVAYLVAPIICIVLIQLAAVLCTRWLEDIFNPRIRAR